MYTDNVIDYGKKKLKFDGWVMDNYYNSIIVNCNTGAFPKISYDKLKIEFEIIKDELNKNSRRASLIDLLEIYLQRNFSNSKKQKLFFIVSDDNTIDIYDAKSSIFLGSIDINNNCYYQPDESSIDIFIVSLKVSGFKRFQFEFYNHIKFDSFNQLISITVALCSSLNYCDDFIKSVERLVSLISTEKYRIDL